MKVSLNTSKRRKIDADTVQKIIRGLFGMKTPFTVLPTTTGWLHEERSVLMNICRINSDICVKRLAVQLQNIPIVMIIMLLTGP